jgi:hypothetical protein
MGAHGDSAARCLREKVPQVELGLRGVHQICVRTGFFLRRLLLISAGFTQKVKAKCLVFFANQFAQLSASENSSKLKSAFNRSQFP